MTDQQRRHWMFMAVMQKRVMCWFFAFGSCHDTVIQCWLCLSLYCSDKKGASSLHHHESEQRQTSPLCVMMLWWMSWILILVLSYVLWTIHVRLVVNMDILRVSSFHVLLLGKKRNLEVSANHWTQSNNITADFKRTSHCLLLDLLTDCSDYEVRTSVSLSDIS